MASNLADSNLTVIVGGGFVGLFTALHLSHHRYPNPVVLIDAQTRFAFKPLLYEYLTGEMQSQQVLPRYEDLLQGRSTTFVQDRVTQIDLQDHHLETASGQHYSYRYLVLAVGSIQGYFGTEGAKDHAFAFRTQQDIERLGQHLRDSLQKAAQTADASERQRLLTVAVVGAGPSGIELAATLADLLPQWYGALGGEITEIRLVLINHGTEILSGDINHHLQATVLEALRQRTIPVELLLGVAVKSVSADQISYQTSDQPKDTSEDQSKQNQLKTLATATTLWTAGTATHPLLKDLALSDAQRDNHGLPVVSPTLQLPDFPNVFAAGDCAVVQSQSWPPVAQVAYQQGAGIARNLLALSQDKPPQPVTIGLRGTLMKLGIDSGVANLFDQLEITGKVGALIRSATYLEMLPAPLHDFKATATWLEDRLFDPNYPLGSVDSPAQPELVSAQATSDQAPVRSALLWILGGVTVAATLIFGINWIQRLPEWPQPPAPQQSESPK